MTVSPNVLVVGALHYDVVVRAPRLPMLDETLPGSSVAYVFGGKGGNQAVAASQHGAATAMAGRVGADAPGRFMLDHLDRMNVDASMVMVDPQTETGMSIAIMTEAGDYGAVIVSGANRNIDSESIAVPATVSVVLLQNEISAAVNAAVAARARSAGVRVIHNAAPARDGDAHLDALVDVRVVNRVEAAALLGRDTGSVSETMQGAAEWPVEQALVITLGGDGVVYREPGKGPRHLPAFAADVQSSHGAGDAFVGALAARLALGSGFAEALQYGQAAAALHVSRAVSGRPMIAPADVFRLVGGG